MILGLKLVNSINQGLYFPTIPILESVPSFETWKLHKWLNSKIVDFYVEINPKSNFQARLVLLSFLRLGNHQSNPYLRSTSSVQNLSSQDQNLRFIHFVWIPSGLSSKLYQGFPFKEQMNSHKCILNLKLHWVTSSTYHSHSLPTSLPPTILLSVPKILLHHSHQKFPSTILNCPSTILHLFAINRRVGFIENRSRKKHIES